MCIGTLSWEYFRELKKKISYSYGANWIIRDTGEDMGVYLVDL